MTTHNILCGLMGLACIGIGGYLIITKGGDSSGWGWFLFVGLCLGGSVTFKKQNKSK